MAGSIGVMFNVGASVNRTVAGAFATVQSRVSGLRRELRGLETSASTATRLTAAQSRLQTVQGQYTAGPTEELRTAVRTAAREFAAANRAARQYGITVDNVSSAQAELTARIARTHAALGRQRQLQANQARRQELQNDILGTVGMAMTVAAPIKVAIEYEVDFADLKKVANFASAEQEKQVQQDIFNASRRTGIDASGMTKIAASAGEAGVVNDAEGNLDASKLRTFLNDAAEMAVAYGISAEEAGERLAIFQTRLSDDGMSLTAGQAKELGDSMNYVASKMNATAADTSSVVARMGAVGSMAGLSAKSVAGLAAALVSTSENKEVAGTAMKSFLLTLSQGDAMTKQQKEAFSKIGVHNVQAIAEGIKRGGPEAEQTILSVLAAMKDMPEAEQAGIAKEIFGTESLASLAPLINDLGKLEKAWALANSPEAAGSQLAEFNTQSETTSGAIKRLNASTGILGITIGSVLLPTLAMAADFAVSVIKPITALADEFPMVTQGIMMAGVGLVALKVSALAGGYAATILSDGWSIAKGAFDFFTPATLRANAALVRQKVVTFGAAAASRAVAVGTKLAAVGQWVLNAAMAANPIGLVIGGLVALGAGMVYLYNTCEPVRTALDSLWSGIKTVGKPVLAALIFPFVVAFGVIKSVFNAVVPMVQSVVGAVSSTAQAIWQTVAGWGVAAWNSICAVATTAKGYAVAAWSSISGFFASLFNALSVDIATIWSGIGSSIGVVWDGVRVKASALFDWLAGKFEWLRTATNFMATSWDKAKSLVGLGDEEEPATEAKNSGATTTAGTASTTNPPVKPVAKPEQTSSWYNLMSWFGGEEETPETVHANPPVQPVSTPTTMVDVPKTTGTPTVDAAPKTVPPTSVVAGGVVARQPEISPQQRTVTVTAPEKDEAPITHSKGQSVPSTPPPASQGPGVHVNVALNVAVNGVPDGEFSSMVIAAIKKRQSDFQGLISGIVAEQRRLSYGA